MFAESKYKVAFLFAYIHLLQFDWKDGFEVQIRYVFFLVQCIANGQERGIC